MGGHATGRVPCWRLTLSPRVLSTEDVSKRNRLLTSLLTTPCVALFGTQGRLGHSVATFSPNASGRAPGYSDRSEQFFYRVAWKFPCKSRESASIATTRWSCGIGAHCPATGTICDVFANRQGGGEPAESTSCGQMGGSDRLSLLTMVRIVTRATCAPMTLVLAISDDGQGQRWRRG